MQAKTVKMYIEIIKKQFMPQIFHFLTYLSTATPSPLPNFEQII